MIPRSAPPSDAHSRRLVDLTPNMRLGAFRLRRRLGRGGFAPVWLADEEYGGEPLRTVALKVFALPAGHGQGQSHPPSSRSSPRERIIDEARALCRVEHPNVVRFYTLYDGGTVVALVMEHVSGETLDARIVRGSGCPLSETFAVGTAMASALSAVHGAGLVHRDIKPTNILDTAGIYKLIDFGIASADAMKGAPVILDGMPLDVDDEGASLARASSDVEFFGASAYAAP